MVGQGAGDGNSLLLAAGEGVGEVVGAVGDTEVPLSTWSHVAVTLLADGPSVTVAFWLNGKASGGGVIAAPGFTPATGLDIGHLPAHSAGKHFDGYIDEVRISTSA
ncbi:MAG TPA: hypothetical protein PK640_20220, partial [Verrucomicrobiota bacterium]|nr:hypothetical protein [Verrucomicrobiota bacterium]